LGGPSKTEILAYRTFELLRSDNNSLKAQKVKECLAAWNTCYTDKKGNYIYKALVNGRGIKVVVAKEDREFVITVADY
jgi:hypothetical protein